MKIGNEPFTRALFEELLPLAQACWKESTQAKADSCAFHGDREFEVEPDYEQYQKMHDSGILIVYTMRYKERLVGILPAALYRSLHHRRMLCANVDFLYVDPDHRGHAMKFIDAFEKELAQGGIHIIGWPTHVNGPVYKLLTLRGYVGDELVMEKRLQENLCAS